MIDRSELTYIGKFGKIHGYKGEINLGFAQFDNDGYLKNNCPLFVELEGCFVPFFVSDYRSRGQHMAWLVTIANPGNKVNFHILDLLEHREVFGLSDQVLQLYPDFQVEEEMDLTGCKIEDEEYGPLGVVTNFDDSTENILIDVELPDGREVTLPLNLDFIKSSTYADPDDEDSVPEILVKYPDGMLQSLLDPDFQKGSMEEEDDN